MNDEEKQLIRDFFNYPEKLRDAGIVRSNNVLGDIGEWLCVKKYGLVLANSGRNPDFDGYIEDKKVQVKLHNAPIGTNVNDVGNPEKYDELIIILGKQSRLRPKNVCEDGFLFYKFSAQEVKNNMKQNKKYSCAKKVLGEKEYECVIL